MMILTESIFALNRGVSHEMFVRLQEIALQQKSKERLFGEVISHIKSLKTQDGESLVEFPQNFDQVVDMAYNEEMARKDLKDKGMIVEADQKIYDYSKHFQYEGDPNTNNQNGGGDSDVEMGSPSKKQKDGVCIFKLHAWY